MNIFVKTNVSYILLNIMEQKLHLGVDGELYVIFRIYYLITECFRGKKIEYTHLISQANEVGICFLAVF